MDDLCIVEASDDLEKGIDGANVGQESIAKTSTGGSTTGQTSDIVNGKVGWYYRLGLVVFDEPIEAVIGDDDTSLLRVDGCVGEVLLLVSLYPGA